MIQRWLWLWAVLCLALAGCHRDGEELAKLETKQGTVDRDFAATLRKWQDAPLAASFKVGDGVRTGPGAGAHLRLSDASGVALQEKTLLRFLATAPGKKAHGLDVEAGEIQLEVGKEGLNLETSAGPAVLEPGSRVTLRKTDKGTRFAVEIGAAHLTDAKQDLKAGESIEIGIGRAVVERSGPAPNAAPPVASAEPAPSASAAAPIASVDVADARARGPDALDVLVGPGDSLVIHDPRPPTAIGFASSRCSGVMVLEIGARKAETIGVGRVSAAFGAGLQRYRVRCADDKQPFAEGTMSILRDAGNRRLSTSAPVNRIDTDGRRYTILYQSLLPKVSVRWPTAPPAGPFTLTVRSQGKGQKQFSAAAASYSLPGGTLSEGSHELWFEAAGQRSRSTTVSVQFDNAAPTASISAPAERGFARGATIGVAGTALPGWSVAAAGQELSQDGQQRFSADVQAPGDVRALLIRFSHPQRGVHYYLRRSSD